jgi:hypothetical protein
VDVVIDGVEIDRSEVCKGEEVIVTVRGRSTDRDGARFMSYGVVGRSDWWDRASPCTWQPPPDTGSDRGFGQIIDKTVGLQRSREITQRSFANLRP